MRPAGYGRHPPLTLWETRDLPSLNYDAMMREGLFAQLMIFHVLIDPRETRITLHRHAVRSMLGKAFHTLVKCCAQQSRDTVELGHKL